MRIKRLVIPPTTTTAWIPVNFNQDPFQITISASAAIGVALTATNILQNTEVSPLSIISWAATGSPGTLFFISQPVSGIQITNSSASPISVDILAPRGNPG